MGERAVQVSGMETAMVSAKVPPRDERRGKNEKLRIR